MKPSCAHELPPPSPLVVAVTVKPPLPVSFDVEKPPAPLVPFDVANAPPLPLGPTPLGPTPLGPTPLVLVAPTLPPLKYAHASAHATSLETHEPSEAHALSTSTWRLLPHTQSIGEHELANPHPPAS